MIPQTSSSDAPSSMNSSLSFRIILDELFPNTFPWFDNKAHCYERAARSKTRLKQARRFATTHPKQNLQTQNT